MRQWACRARRILTLAAGCEEVQAVLADGDAKNDLKLVSFGIGLDDFPLLTAKAAVKTLIDHGFDVVYGEIEGGHTWLNR